MPTNTEERPRVYLNKVHLKGYKSIEDVTIDFQKGLNILIGKNGSGKSNLLEMIELGIGFIGETKKVFDGIKLEFSIKDHSYVFDIKRDLSSQATMGFQDRMRFIEKFLMDDELIYDEYRAHLDLMDSTLVYHGPTAGFFYSWAYHNVNLSFIKYNLPDNLGCIDFSGILKAEIRHGFFYWDFPYTLNFINAIFSHLEKFFQSEFKGTLNSINSSTILDNLTIPDNIIYNLKLHTPIEDIRFNGNINIYTQENSLIIDNIKLDFKVNGNWIPWSQLSDGTKRLFYIVAEVTNTKTLALIEEPELGVHPHQFHLLMNFLKEQSEHKQIIISTHAPKALDHLNLDELNSILLVNYDQKNGTQLRHLTDDEQAKAQEYAKEVGYVSDYWMYSDLEE